VAPPIVPIVPIVIDARPSRIGAVMTTALRTVPSSRIASFLSTIRMVRSSNARAPARLKSSTTTGRCVAGSWLTVAVSIPAPVNGAPQPRE